MDIARNQRVSNRTYTTRSSALRAARKRIGTAMRATDPYVVFSGPSISYADCGVTSDKIDCTYSCLDGWIVVRGDMISVIEDGELGGYRWCIEWWLEDLVWGIYLVNDPKPELTFRELINWTGPRDEYGWPRNMHHGFA